MDAPYLWPDANATLTLNALLDLPATGREQDWEVEMAEPDRLPQMLVLFNGGTLDLESRSALALLMLHALDLAAAAPPNTINSVRTAIDSDPTVKRRMLSYWSHHQQINHIVSLVLSST